MIYLASASPRRRELLRQLGIEFEAMPSNLLEVRSPGEAPERYVARVALDKARYVAAFVRVRGLAECPVLGADTEVVLAGEILGKPRDRSHGIEMLTRLASRTHEVLTGVAVLHAGVEHAALSRSRVTFGPLSAGEIARYWESGEPRDKAGGYAVQDRRETIVTAIQGSHSNVVGLPKHLVLDLLHWAHKTQ